MNKRQAKKKKRNEMLLGYLTYREDRQLIREVKEFEISQSRFKKTPEDIECLVELGIYTWEEVKNKRYGEHKEKRRWRQIRKAK